LLLQISASELVASERGMSGEFLALKALRARLLAERANASAISPPTEFASLSSEDRTLAEDAMQGQTQLFQARRASIATERNVLEQRVRQHSEQIGGIEHQILANQAQQSILEDELQGLRKLVPDGYVAMNRVREMERTAAELVGQGGSFRADTARLNEAIGE